MPKKKKTLKQKKLSDLRREQEPVVSPLSVSEKNTFQKSEAIPAQPMKTHQTAVQQTIPTSNYNYLSSDLLKTAIVTGVIIVLELLLHYLGKGMF